MLFNNARTEMLEKENEGLQKELRNVREERNRYQEMNIAQLRQKAELRRNLQIAEQENEKFQQINDELVTRLIKVAKEKMNDKALNEYKMALEIKNKELDQQAKYVAELRSYVASLHEKIRKINVDRKHHEERANKYARELEEVNRKRHFDTIREKQILDNRVSKLYEALEEIQEIVEDVI